MNKNRWVYLMFMMLLVLSMGLAACGGDEEGGNGGGGEQPAPTVAPSPTTGAAATEEAGDVTGTEPAATEEAGAATDEGDPANGETLFASLGCSGCHSVEPGAADTTGPNLAGIAVRAGTRVPDLDAVAYIHQSLTDPGAFVVEGFENIMPPFGGSETELNDLIAYLMTLDQE